MANPDAFVLLTIPNTTLTGFGTTQSGTLNLECVTLPIPGANSIDRDVYLVLRLNSIETAIDPARIIHRTTDVTGRSRTYTFQPTSTDPSELVVSIPLPSPVESTTEDLETFESILAQYADLRGTGVFGLSSSSSTHTDDLRGQLVMINEDTGEVLGQFDDAQFRVQEDPRMHEKGRENDAVIIEVPERRSGEEQDATAMEMFVRAVPADQQDWITKSATIVSHAISQTTNLLLTTITTASSYYIANSKPSPHHSSSSTPAISRSISPSSSPPSISHSGSASSPSLLTQTPPPPPRALVFLTSERTRKGLAGVHTISGQAVKVSSKTVSVIDGMIRSALGGGPKREKFTTSKSVAGSGVAPSASSSSSSKGSPALLSPSQTPPRLPLRSPSPAGLGPPPAYSRPGGPFPTDNKPALPPRRSPSPVPPSGLTHRSVAGTGTGTSLQQSGTSVQQYNSSHEQYVSGRQQANTTQIQPSLRRNNSDLGIQQPQRPAIRLTKKERVLLSADLIFATIDNETRRLLDTGTERVGAVVGHKYGAEAKETSLLVAGTARNVGLVYVDMRGIGRRALLKQAGMQFVRGRSNGLGEGESEGVGKGQGESESVGKGKGEGGGKEKGKRK